MILQVIVTIPRQQPLTINFHPTDYASSLPSWQQVKIHLQHQTRIPVERQKLTTVGGLSLQDFDKVVRSDEMETGMGAFGEVVVMAKPVCCRLDVRSMCMKNAGGGGGGGGGGIGGSCRMFGQKGGMKKRCWEEEEPDGSEPLERFTDILSRPIKRPHTIHAY
ncbi:hypothetical protein HK097_000558 [Rhizophlyctis rosea]|uniref:Uncharacterized protein n=1 Tax=Rhizophlyctis rosea TaxID=64517 RepID=A0AAD5SJV5_9FUNG|nr:hypothetical protein HK097_000558 [Rhizophlyctis rosea]